MAQRGYYLNGLKGWHDRLSKERALLVARYGRMVKMQHPSALDQRALICLNARMSELVSDALRTAHGEHVSEQK